MKNYLKYLFYIIIPIIVVFLCRILEVAQGEKNEEIIFGIMLGIFLDIIFCVTDCIIGKLKTRKQYNYNLKERMIYE